MELELNDEKYFILSQNKESVIAIDECKMYDDNDLALVYGKSYDIRSVDYKNQEFTIKSELFEYHKFYFSTVVDLEFSQWYSGMQFPKIVNAVKRWRRDVYGHFL